MERWCRNPTEHVSTLLSESLEPKDVNNNDNPIGGAHLLPPTLLIKPTVLSNGQYKNHANDYAPWIHFLQIVYDMHKGGFREYPYLESNPLFQPTPNAAQLITETSSGHNNGIRCLWLGHASFLLSFRGTTILTDPNFVKNIPFDGLPLVGTVTLYSRLTPPGLEISELPQVDTILVSHNHADHLEPGSVWSIVERDSPECFFPQGTGSRYRREQEERSKSKKLHKERSPPQHAPSEDDSIAQMKKDLGNVCRSKFHDVTWWDRFVLANGVVLTAVPAHHSSCHGIGSTQHELWNGWVIQYPIDDADSSSLEQTSNESNQGYGRKYCTVYYTGDTAAHLDPHAPGHDPTHADRDCLMFTQIAAAFPHIDLLLLPIDPVEGEENMHGNAIQLMTLLRLLKPVHFVPMHYGTWPFNVYDGVKDKVQRPIEMFQGVVKSQGGTEIEAKMVTMSVGEVIELNGDSIVRFDATQ